MFGLPEREENIELKKIPNVGIFFWKTADKNPEGAKNSNLLQ